MVFVLFLYIFNYVSGLSGLKAQATIRSDFGLIVDFVKIGKLKLCLQRSYVLSVFGLFNFCRLTRCRTSSGDDDAVGFFCKRN